MIKLKQCSLTLRYRSDKPSLARNSVIKAMSEGQCVVSIPFPKSDIGTLAADGALHQHASHSRVSIWSWLRGSEAEKPSYEALKSVKTPARCVP